MIIVLPLRSKPHPNNTSTPETNNKHNYLLGHDAIGKFFGFAHEKGAPVREPAHNGRVGRPFHGVEHFVQLFGKGLGCVCA